MIRASCGGAHLTVRGHAGYGEGVGTHIGDQTHGALALNVHAFIELLGDGHSAPGRHIQLAGGLLLEGRGGEGRCGLALLARQYPDRVEVGS